VGIAAQGYAIYQSVFVEPGSVDNVAKGGRYAQFVIIGIAVATLIYVLIKKNWSKNSLAVERQS
jgi:hypothetical protein